MEFILQHFIFIVKPEVLLRNKRIGQSVGKETILECIINASPLEDYYWKRGSQKIVRDRDWNYRIEIYPEKPYTVYLRLHIVSLDAKYKDPTTTTTTVRTTTVRELTTTMNYRYRKIESQPGRYIGTGSTVK
ncbi:hypothetical protein KUTeg_017859 [Tegillarca granosa]|uniref:Ig-like domain-containing protein n=1 Tax=Tegillarca granosa TaxID=220873 RepID=A0ABQ9EIM5_TEGGR|nr:hypothetical protein KUTeg_017859 [Tegillarca granosa]